jgi:hypothetical protein
MSFTGGRAGMGVPQRFVDVMSRPTGMDVGQVYRLDLHKDTS